MTRDEVMKVWADASDAYLADGVGPNCAAAATVIQQAFAAHRTLTAVLAYDAGKLDGFAERDGEIERLRVALETVMVGGNHLALLIDVDHPSYTADPLSALEHYGAGFRYEAWLCWRSIMQARQALEDKGNEND